MSSDDVAIRLAGVSKTFSIYERPHHRLFATLFGNRWRTWHRDFHALSGVDLEIRRGETLGIVGRNGSGKSTLLQIICGILAPTRGTVEARGRIAALLELGAGFNPEFTGRENVFLNGAVLGLTREETEQRFDAIVAFADVGDFIDQPVKTYSSGMFIRLAFAVAINVEPEILVVDEALAVGDEAFQRKCYARIQRIRENGATVLFVSHSAGTVAELCDRVALLDAGEMIALGAPKPVISRYHKLLYAPAGEAAAIHAHLRAELEHGACDESAPASVDRRNEDEAHAPGDDIDGYYDPTLMPGTLRYAAQGARIEDARIETLAGRRVNVLRAGRDYVYTYRATFERTVSLVRFGMMIRTVSGLELGGAASAVHGRGVDLIEAGSEVRIAFRFRCLLAGGTYFLNAGVLGRLAEEEVFLDRQVDAAMFRVMPDAERLATGLVDFEVEPSVDVEVDVVRI
ncbi:MAG TPA: ABC transporter ATP-binding protein [Rhodanobacteraceae bacterium]|nr:ABC transporter ATP-binding protein [Rhodanobacteraceae bacterium]